MKCKLYPFFQLFVYKVLLVLDYQKLCFIYDFFVMDANFNEDLFGYCFNVGSFQLHLRKEY